MPRSRTTSLLRAALVAALLGASALVVLPIGPVPVTLQVLVVAVAALVLSPAEALGAGVLYLALGTIGLPVFAGGGAGPGVLLGPTGGFIAGFALGAAAGAAVRRLVARPARSPLVADVPALVILLLVVYGSGWAWFALTTGRSAADAFALAVAPFVLVDAAKAAVALGIARALRGAGVVPA